MLTIPALSVIQPHATLIAIDAKRFETRGWRTTYRGLLAIHASKRFPWERRALCVPELWRGNRSPIHDALQAGGIRGPEWTGRRGGSIRLSTGELPLGAVIAVAVLDDVVRIGPSRAASERLLLPDQDLDEQERAFGSYHPGRYAWHLTNVQLLPAPVPAAGALNLWDWQVPDEHVPLIHQLRRRSEYASRGGLGILSAEGAGTPTASSRSAPAGKR
jgi:activating signal cointegrator 1